MSISGFVTFAAMDLSTWYEYESLPQYTQVTSRIRQMFFSQKFEGAASGLLESNIIARELGLSEKQEVTNTKIQINIALPGEH